MEFTVQAIWDTDASVWVAESEDVPGLVTEAETLEPLLAKLRVLIPELLEANGLLPPDGDQFHSTSSPGIVLIAMRPDGRLRTRRQKAAERERLLV